MTEELAARMFALRDAAHAAHWAATGPGSYAKHMALGELYEAIPGKVDTYVETAQGFFGLIDPITPLPYTRDDIEGQIKAMSLWLDDNRDEITGGKPALDNLLQEIEAMLAQAYYKLMHLA